MANSTAGNEQPRVWRGVAGALVVFSAVLALLFARSFDPPHLLFANDGPLGALKANAIALPSAFQGIWQDLNWLGFSGGAATPTASYVFLWWLGPVGFAKFYGPLATLILAISAWTFFRRLGLSTWLAAVTGLAAALNTNCFSNMCWGLGTRPLTLSAALLAMSLTMANGRSLRLDIVRALLAGLCVGVGVVEGADVGAIFSLFVAAYIVVFNLVTRQPASAVVGRSSLQLMLVVIAALWIAIEVIQFQFQIQIKDVSAPKTQESPEQHWDWATQWSLPPAETLRVVIPGLYGYRMDTPNGGQYWGAVGQTPGWPQHHLGTPRFSGAGEYAGILVVLLAAWALAQSLVKSQNPFNPGERKLIWFWAVMALVSLLFAYGRYAPFYRIIYALPYFSNIRNPIKFMHPFHMALLILFGYGLLAISRRHLTSQPAPAGARAKSWWAQAPLIDKRWLIASASLLGLSVAAWAIYASAQQQLVRHLTSSGFDPGQGTSIARFSVTEVGIFVLFFAASLGVLALIFRGTFAGPRAKWAAVILGLLLVIDLGRANQPWIIYYNYKYKYATNPILEQLQEKAYEHRVTVVPFSINRELGLLQQLYGIEWLQHHFQYYNIQSIDTIQMPREPADFAAYRGSNGIFSPQKLAVQTRFWQLTNTRYLLGLGGTFVDALNQQLDPVLRRFKLHTSFDLGPKPEITQPKELADLTAVPNANGTCGLIEFTGALPRAKLYSDWTITTNDQQALDELVRPEFDPEKKVLVAPGALVTKPASPEKAAGTVEFVHYAPKRVELKADAPAPAVLLLNDKYDPNWKVTVDGKPGTLLRCNFLMRGVEVGAGSHRVVFSYEPKNTGLWVSLSAIAAGLVLCGFLIFGRRTETGDSGRPPASDKPVPSHPAPPPKPRSKK